MNSKRQLKIQKVLLSLSVLFMFLFSITFLFMKPANTRLINTGDQTFLNIVGASFWATLALSVITIFLMSIRCRKYKKSIGATKKSRPGMFRFFSNMPAKIVDILMMVSLVLLVCFIAFFSENYLIYIFLSTTIFSFFMHCVLNGENYRYITNSGIEENGVC